jgi:uncharacterized protein involved in exopolysaccharide biosynthesis
MVENKGAEEIDLLRLLLKAVKILENNILLIASFFVVGSLVGFLWYSMAKKVFESKLLISSNILTESYSKELIGKLDALVRDGNLGTLAKRLNLTESEAKSIQKFEIANADLRSDLLKESEKVYLAITVRVSDQQVLIKLQEKIVSYLENNEYVKVRVEQKKHALSMVLKTINEEISGLEDFKIRIYKGDFLASAKGNIMFDPTTVNTKIVELTEKKALVETDLALIKSVQVIDGFTVYNRPISPKLSVSLASGSSVGLLFVVLFIAFKALRKISTLEG